MVQVKLVISNIMGWLSKYEEDIPIAQEGEQKGGELGQYGTGEDNNNKTSIPYSQRP